MKEIPSTWPLELRSDTGSPINLIGLPLESLVLTMVSKDGTTCKGTGKFIIVDAFMGRMIYEFSEEDMQMPPGAYRLYVGYDKKLYEFEAGAIAIRDLKLL